MATLGERGGRFHSCRAAAGDEPARGGFGPRQRAAEPTLAPGRRVDRAGDRQALEDAPDAALVAADAVDDLVLAAVAGLVRELGVGDLGAGHRHHVRLPGGEDLLGERGVLDPADREHRQRHGRLHLRGQIDEVAVGHVGGLDRAPDVVVAGGGDVDVVDSARALELLGDADGILDVEAARDEVGEADPDADDPVGADPASHLVDHLPSKAQAVLERAAVLVRALVVERREELVEEVAVRDVHLGAVEAALARELRRASPPLDHLADVLVLHRLRRLAVGRALHRRRPPEHAQIVRGVARRVQAEVVELREDHRAVLVDGIGQPPVGLERLPQIRPGDARKPRRRGRVDDAVAGDQQTCAALRARGLVVDVPLGVHGAVREELDVRRLHDPVPDGHAADPERAEEMRVGAHGVLLRRRG